MSFEIHSFDKTKMTIVQTSKIGATSAPVKWGHWNSVCWQMFKKKCQVLDSYENAKHDGNCAKSRTLLSDVDFYETFPTGQSKLCWELILGCKIFQKWVELAVVADKA